MEKFMIRLIGSWINFISTLSPALAARQAMNLFATPRKGKLTEHQKRFLAKAERDLLHSKDLNIMTYKWAGDSGPVLLAHGWESNSFRWKPLIELLQNSGYEVIALDAPAHGQSDGKKFNAILYSHAIETAAEHYRPECIIGHSVGGMAAVFCLHRKEPEFLKKIILLGAPAHFKGVLDRYVRMMRFNRRTFNAMVRWVIANFNHHPDYFSSADFCRELKASGLIIHDRGDRVIPYQDALLYEKNCRNSRLLSTVGFGHGLKDSSVYDEILNFLEQ